MGKWLGKDGAIVAKARELIPSGAETKDQAGARGDKGMIGKAVDKVREAVVGLRDERSLGAILHKDVQGALQAIIEANPRFEKIVDQAYGYAVFPEVGRASLVLGGSYGKGEVFERGKLIGYAGIGQMTLGVQAGGGTLTVLVIFANEAGLNRFKQGRMGFAANASVAIIKAGAGATNQYKGDQVFVFSEGGLLIEAAIGVQKFVFRPAALTRGRSPEPEHAPERTAAMLH